MNLANDLYAYTLYPYIIGIIIIITITQIHVEYSKSNRSNKNIRSSLFVSFFHTRFKLQSMQM